MQVCKTNKIADCSADQSEMMKAAPMNHEQMSNKKNKGEWGRVFPTSYNERRPDSRCNERRRWYRYQYRVYHQGDEE